MTFYCKILVNMISEIPMTLQAKKKKKKENNAELQNKWNTHAVCSLELHNLA